MLMADVIFGKKTAEYDGRYVPEMHKNEWE